MSVDNIHLIDKVRVRRDPLFCLVAILVDLLKECRELIVYIPLIVGGILLELVIPGTCLHTSMAGSPCTLMMWAVIVS